ncbi:MAG: alpha/beta fold hydrolase [Proteobacteria bacterium]|nr:alpha/beta fold hydrolase [Pseudomonadota bacterium]
MCTLAVEVGYLRSFLTLLLLVTSNVSAIENSYQLILDNELAARKAEIDTFWDGGKTGSFTGVNGASLGFKHFVKPQARAGIVIVNGRTESYLKYKELAFNLSQNGYSVYTYDHIGQGLSARLTQDKQQGHIWDFDDYVSDLNRFYQQIVRKYDSEHLFLLGYSMGGTISSLYVQQYPTDFKALALVSPMHQPDTGLLGGAICKGAGFTTKVRDLLIETFDLQPRYALGQGAFKFKSFAENSPQLMTHSQIRFEQLQQLYTDNEAIRLGGATSHWLANACAAAKQSINEASEIQIPVLLLQAEKDIAVTARGQNKFCEQLAQSKNNQCEYTKPVIIKGAYHELFIESDVYRIPALSHILNFFESRM